MGNGALAFGPKLPRPSSTLPNRSKSAPYKFVGIRDERTKVGRPPDDTAEEHPLGPHFEVGWRLSRITSGSLCIDANASRWRSSHLLNRRRGVLSMLFPTEPTKSSYARLLHALVQRRTCKSSVPLRAFWQHPEVSCTAMTRKLSGVDLTHFRRSRIGRL